MNEIMDHISEHASFEQQYISLRAKEGRIYADEQVRSLPSVSKEHPLNKEWKLREYSAGKLMSYLRKKGRPINILEVGCGNGWLSHQLSLIPDSRVTGIDVNTIELEQAERVFTNPRLQFVYGDIRHINLGNCFNQVLFAASVQYFSSLTEVINAAMEKLEQGGEIHIVDTHFYVKEELADAARRSKKYFEEIGTPLMQHYYFHHSLEALDGFSYQVLYDPASITNRIFKQSPFPWIRIKKC